MGAAGSALGDGSVRSLESVRRSASLGLLGSALVDAVVSALERYMK